MQIHSPTVLATHHRAAELDRLGDEIAELSAHLDAATARLLEQSRDGIKAYSINIVGSLVGVLLYTGLSLLYQPPAIWFVAAGAMLLAAFPAGRRIFQTTRVR